MFAYTCEMVKVNDFPVLQRIHDIYAEKDIPQILTIKTYYEQQWLERGLSIKYISFVPQERDKFVEPDIEIEHDEYRSFKRFKRHQ